MSGPYRPYQPDRPYRPYHGREIVFGTRHGKQRQAAPAFAELLGATVTAPPDLDTDRFGTFTGEVARVLAPLDAARAKVRLAVDATGAALALASEASYGTVPGWWAPGHEELLLFADLERAFELVEAHRAVGVPGVALVVRDAAELPADLPAGGSRDPLDAQALIVRPDGAGAGGGAVKGVVGRAALAAAVADAAARSPSGLAVVEPDLRAHHNPSRRRVLEGLARRLAARLAVPCPECGGPGFGRDRVEPGLRCAACGLATELPAAEEHRCPGCGYARRVPLPGSAEPRWCPGCNP